MGSVARRLLVALTAVMPASRRVWGEAMLAELDQIHSARDQARLVLGAARIALLPPAVPAGYGQAIGHAAITAVVAWIPLGVVLYLSNVVFPASEDNTLGVITIDLYLVIVLMAAGAAAWRASAGTGAPIIAGMVAGLIIGALVMGTFAVIDNVFLAIVSHQQGKIDGLRASGMTSMRAYINASLEATAPGVSLILAFGGAFLAALGASAARDVTTAWARIRGLPHRDHIP
jgi:hypothetical protein